MQRRAKSLQHEPCGLLSDAQSAVNLHAGHSIFAVDQHPECRHPFVESKGRVLEDRLDLDGELPLAALAEPNLASPHEPVFRRSAPGTHDLAIRPAQFDGKGEGTVRIGEVNDGLLECFRLFHVSYCT
jgi:hypothetical protein